MNIKHSKRNMDVSRKPDQEQTWFVKSSRNETLAL